MADDILDLMTPGMRRERVLQRLPGGAGRIRTFGVARSHAEGKRAQMLVNFRVELRWNPQENEFAMSSVRFQSSTLNSGVARTRLGCETTLRRTQVVWGRRSRDQFNQFSLLTTEVPGLPRGAGWCLESYGGKEAYYPMLKAVSGHLT